MADLITNKSLFRRNALVPQIPVINERRNALTSDQFPWMVPKSERIRIYFEKLKDNCLDKAEIYRNHVNRKTAKFLWLMLCLSIFSTQAVIQTVTYFKYQVSSEIMIDMEQQFRPPSLSMCFLTKDVLLSKGVIKLYEKSITLNQALGLFYRKPVLRASFVSSDINSGQRLSLFMRTKDMVTFFKNKMICTKIRFPISHTYLERINMLTTTGTGTSQVPFINIFGVWDETYKNSTVISFFVHNSKVFPRGYQSPSLRSWLKKAHILTYKEYLTRFLAPPYSQCFNYTQDIMESKEHCTESCLKSEIFRRYNFSLDTLTYSFDEGNVFMNYLNNRYENQIFQMEKVCQNKCPIGCYLLRIYVDVSITPFLVKASSQLESLANNFRVSLIHDNPITEISFTPKQLFIDYAIQVASLSSLWLGFVIFDSFIQLMNFIVILLERRKQRKIIINQNNIQPQFFVYSN